MVILVILFTPLGGFIYNEQNVRDSVITIQQKVAALQDTLEARNLQLQQIQEIMITGEDTTFSAPFSRQLAVDRGEQQAQSTAPSPQQTKAKELPNDVVLISNLFERSSDFPAPFPLEGTTTRIFNSSMGHYGIDIAAKDDSDFKAVADGVILNQDWSLNYGYVIVVQHSNGLITIYKHASSTAKNVGESVLKGDILGTIGDVGILSTGPHLHIEIWENGIPQNPQNYLIKS